MKNRTFLLLSIVLISLLFSCSTATKNGEFASPNIVYILADDLGYGDVSALNPDSKIKTPNMDKIAEEGMVFTDAHSNASVCTPTRYGILTGQYCWRSRIKTGVLLGYSPTLIEENTPTIAKYLQQKGYKTACIGKWHLGIDFKLTDGTYHQGEPGVEFSQELKGFKDYKKIDFSAPAKGGPKAAGFDYSYILPASLDFQPYMYLENNKAVEAPTAFTEGSCLTTEIYAVSAFWRAGQMSPSFTFDGVLPTFRKKAVEYIQNQKNSKQPFFLYFPMSAPHTPWMPTEEFRGKSGAGEYGDFVQMVDFQVGEILKALDENNLSENTLLVFASDNGAKWEQAFINEFNHRSNFTFRGMKSDVWEGGHHIPFLVKWPGKIKAGALSEQTTSLTDFFATVQNLFEKELSQKAPDSFSLLPILTGETEKIERAPIVHHSGAGKFGIRDGDWKYIEGLGSGGFSLPKFPKPGPGEPNGQLYNLKTDPQEKNNVYFEYPEKVEELKNKLKELRGY